MWPTIITCNSRDLVWVKNLNVATLILIMRIKMGYKELLWPRLIGQLSVLIVHWTWNPNFDL